MKRLGAPLVTACAVATLTVAALARADGLPVLGVDVGRSGVATRDNGSRYVTVAVGTKTLVERVATRGGQILGSRLLAGTFTIPAVAYDGSASGLSADGKTLVLIQPRRSFPRAETAFAFLSTHTLRRLARVTLHGDFSFDAISPRGKLMYLIEYNDPRNPFRYRVRAYDMQDGRLLAAPVVDPREHTDRMRGSPLTRTTSVDGRVAYTLYDGGGATPFVHALDTSRRTARCIDLAMLAGRSYLWQLRLFLSRDGRILSVRDQQDVEAVIDTHTFRVTTSQPLAAPRPMHHGSPFPLAAVVLATALPLLGAVVAIARFRQRPARTGEAVT